MKTFLTLFASIVLCATMVASSKPDVIGGSLSDQEKAMVHQLAEKHGSVDRLEIFALFASKESDISKTSLFTVEKLKDSLDKDLTFENPELQVVINARISVDKRGEMYIAYTLYSGSRYLEFRNKVDEAKAQNRFLSAQTGANLLLLKKKPTILYRQATSSTFVPLDASQATKTDNSAFTIIALRK